jgi:hypothetical protein
MAAIAVNVLWFLIGLIILCGVIWLVIWVVEQFIMQIPEQIKKGIWVIVLLLALIALIGALVGGGGFRFPSVRGESSGPATALSTPAAPDHQREVGGGVLWGLALGRR